MYKPDRFRRSTERKVEDPNEQLAIEADRALQAQVAAFESRAGGAPAESRSCRDESDYDLNGRTW